MNNFQKRYPDFASIESQIRRAHAERSVAIAAALADGIVATFRGIARLFSFPPAARRSHGRVVAKAAVQRQAA